MKLISIITSNPIFIKLQYESFKKYMKTPYDYIVFNDGKNFPDFTNNNTPNKNEITELCKELNIMCIEIENESHRKNKSCSIRHADSLKVVLEYMKENLDEYLIIDGDMFMIDHLDINKYRKYNTYDQAIELFKNEFNIIDQFPMHLGLNEKKASEKSGEA